MNPPPDPERFLPTRQSLLSRLKSWDDHDSWREFFDTYWRLIHDFARRAGLDDAAAEDVVQETIVAVARQMPGFRYDRSQGSFKAWLLQITRRRVADALRRKYRAGEVNRADPDDPAVAAEVAELAAADGASLEAAWDEEWRSHLTGAALERVKRRVKPEHFQMFELYVLREWPVGKVARALGTSVGQVYLTKHRVGTLLRRELAQLAAQLE